MSSTFSLRKKSGQPRFIIFLCALIALWVAVPLILEFTSNTASAQTTNTAAGLNAQLTGDPIAGVTPRGSANYLVIPTMPNPMRQLFVGVSNINLPSGTQLGVNLNSSPIGTITLLSNSPAGLCQGSLRLSTAAGDTVPDVVAGDTLTIGPAPTEGSVTYLSGTFVTPPTPSQTATHTPFPTPSHTPFPTPSHTPFPTPSSTPLPPRVFATRLNGASEVPPVTTDGMGFGFALLNPGATQIRVCLGFRNLSSAVTAVTINGPASSTENGPVIFTLTLPASANGFSSQTFDVTPEQVAQLRGSMWYFQVATVNNPDGEIRGQIKPITPRAGSGPMVGGNGGGNLVMSGDSDDASATLRAMPDAAVTGDDDNYVLVPFDFDDDGVTDIAAFRGGVWSVTRSSDGRTVPYQDE